MKHRDPLPEHFDNLEDAAEFWDTHDSADYEEYMKDIECEVSIKEQIHIITLENDDIE